MRRGTLLPSLHSSLRPQHERGGRGCYGAGGIAWPPPHVLSGAVHTHGFLAQPRAAGGYGPPLPRRHGATHSPAPVPTSWLCLVGTQSSEAPEEPLCFAFGTWDGLFFLRCCRFPLIRTAVTFWPSRTSPAASLCPAVRFWWGGGDVHAMPFAPFPQQHPAAMGAFGWLSAQPPPPEQSQEMEMGIK